MSVRSPQGRHSARASGPRYAVFSDESRHTASRFRSIAAVSLAALKVERAQLDLAKILAESGIREFKWKKMTSAKARFGAIKMIDYLLASLVPNEARVDVLTWDVQDTRHDRRGRDDAQNLERMYFHLHKNLMQRRRQGAGWHLRPDEQSAMDWPTIRQCLQAVGRWSGYADSLFPNEPERRGLYSVESLREVRSHEHPLCQLADLFAGMVPYTRDKAKVMTHLLAEESGQDQLFGSAGHPAVSTADCERFRVVLHLAGECKKRGLGVSFASSGFLATHDPRKPLNFWHYQPQHPEDRAPVRGG